ncbi:MAG: hypothetical protein AB8B48_01170 [Pseudomonadales bacterium]
MSEEFPFTYSSVVGTAGGLLEGENGEPLADKGGIGFLPMFVDAEALPRVS